MKKRKTANGKIERNPLSQALGSFLRKERDALRKTSNDIAQEVEIGSSFYRMIEAGSANLHPSRLLKVINAFPNSGIEFDLLSKYVVGIQMVETHLDSVESLRNVIDELTVVDAEFEKLFCVFLPIYPFLESEQLTDVKKHLDSEAVYIQVREFLTNRFYELEPETRLNHELNSLIEQTPSFYLEFALNTLKSLQSLPVSIFFSELWRWEKQHINDFTELNGFVLDYQGVTGSKNLERYQYSYLWENQFQKVNFIFADSGKTAAQIKSEFENNLRKALEMEPLLNESKLQNFDKAMMKVNMKTCNLADERVEKFLTNNELKHQVNALWIFSLVSNNNVGFSSFIHHENQKIVEGTSLRYKETVESLETFKHLWKELDTKP